MDMDMNYTVGRDAPISQHESYPVQWDQLPSRAMASAIMALSMHLLVFRKGEWHLWAPQLFYLWVLSQPVLFMTEMVIGNQSLLSSAGNTLLTSVIFTVVFFSSMAIYRHVFHPLRSFPGPKMAAVSKLWHSVQCRNGKNFLVLDALNQKYGDFVRTGPNEITIFNPEALYRLDGPGNKTTKSVWYDFLMPFVGVTTIRDKGFHDSRRKIWTQAFSGKALPIYEQQMAEHADKLEALIGAAADKGKPVNFSSMAYWFSFDVMGMFALSKSFDMISSQNWHYAVSNLRRAMSLLGPLSAVPWLAQIGFTVLKGRWRVKDWHSMTGWCNERMQERIENYNDGTDITSFIIADSVKRDTIKEDANLLAGEAVVAIVAGSDTVAPTLVFLFYELALDPSRAEKLFAELKDVDIDDRTTLAKLPYLNGLINETLRLHPAVPTGGYRDTPPEGMTIGGRFIPGNTTIVAPRYSILRSERCYNKPTEFIPERWNTAPELIIDSRSFLPFAQGRYTCLGKALALSELRTVTALLVSKYNISFRPGDRGELVEADLRDQFTAAPGELELMFSKR